MLKKYCLVFIIGMAFLNIKPHYKTDINIENNYPKKAIPNTGDHYKTNKNAIITNVTSGGNLSN